jgi:hypothetical protein
VMKKKGVWATTMKEEDGMVEGGKGNDVEGGKSNDGDGRDNGW